MPLSVGESRYLEFVGVAYLRDVESMTINLFFYGIFVVLFSASIVVFTERGFRNREVAVMFAATVFNFVLSTMALVTVAGTIIYIRTLLVNTVDLPLRSRPSLVSAAVHSPNIVGFWAGLPPTWTSDLIVVWRAWVILHDQRWLLILPCVLWVGTVAIHLTFLIINTTPSGYNIWMTTGEYNYLYTIGLGLSIATNAVATMLIGYKLWSHRVVLMRNLGLEKRESPVQKVLMVLIESGVLYCLLQIMYFVVFLRPDGGLYVEWIISSLYAPISAMYPTVIILLVERQRSMANYDSFSTSHKRVHNKRDNTSER